MAARRFLPAPHKRGAWYWVTVMLSLGMLAAVPYLHAAWALRDRRLWLLGSVFAVVNAPALSLVFGSDDALSYGVIDDLVGTASIAVFVVAVAMLNPIVRRVYPATGGSYGATDVRQRQAVAAVEYARHRRWQARKIVQSDPMMARELRIGRLDLPRYYDDGGLVDLNTAPGPVLAYMCGVDSEVAERIIASRNQCAGSARSRRRLCTPSWPQTPRRSCSTVPSSCVGLATRRRPRDADGTTGGTICIWRRRLST